MDIAIAFDQTFLTPFYVLITSILYNNSESEINFHVIATDVPQDEKDQISAYIKKHKCCITYYDVDPEQLSITKFPQTTVYPISTYYRLLFPYLVNSSIQKLLYLDTDIVVIKDLKELFQTDLGAFPVGAVAEPFAPPRPDLGIYKQGSYINSGVLLINLPQWLRNNITERTKDFIIEHQDKLIWLDQDALNAVLKNNYYSLNHKYNLTSEFVSRSMPLQELKQFVKNKVIIHFTSGYVKKPWSALSTNRLRFIYHEYLRISPHRYKKKYTDFTYSKQFLADYIRIRVVDWLIDHPKLLQLVNKSKQ
jgi:lipopolysaccharide biosynthesis glycosyltransferase